MEKNFKFEIPKNVKEFVKELKKENKLSEYEALTIALKVEQNELLKETNVWIKCGLGVYPDDGVPSFLEAIAMALKDRS